MLKIRTHHLMVTISLLLIIATAFSVYYINPRTIKISNVKAEGVYANIGTGDAQDASNDGLNYSQGNVLHIDNFGKYLMLTQERTGPTTHWSWSNNEGATWTQGSESYSFLTRGSVAYDSKNDLLHVIWAATDSNDGIIYRRYSISRDVSNNITSIQRVDSGTVNLQLDVSSTRTLSQPIATWYDDGSTNGILVATWTKYGGGIFEVRSSMRNLSNSAADGMGGNWISPDGSADTFATDAPLIAADKVANSSSTTIAGVTVRGGTGLRQKDLYIFVYEASFLRAYRAIWNAGTLNWSGGWQSGINIGAVDPTQGYGLKYELITKPVLDIAHDRLFIAWPTWRDNTLGDTVAIAYLDASDSPSAVYDVYSANGSHNYAPTVDIAYDSARGRMYVSYIESTTNGSDGHIFYRVFDGTTLSAPVDFFTIDQADIPVMYPRSVNNRILMVFRRNGSLPPTPGDPHTIYFGYIPLTVPTVQFTTLTSSGLESVTTVNVAVSASETSSIDMTVNYSVVGGTATGSGTDYTLASGTLTIPAGSLTNNITFNVVNDMDDEADETIDVTLSAPVNSILGSQTTHTYTITDDDITPTSSPTSTATATPTSTATATATTTTTVTTTSTATSTPTSTTTATSTTTTTSTTTETPTDTVTSTTTQTTTPSGFTIKFITESNSIFNLNSNAEIVGETSLKNAEVKLKILETGEEFNTTSDENGKFTFQIPNSIEPGKYTLSAEVKKDGETSKSTVTFEVVSQPNYTWLWILLVGIILVIIGYLVYRYRKNKADKEYTSF